MTINVIMLKHTEKFKKDHLTEIFFISTMICSSNRLLQAEYTEGDT